MILNKVVLLGDGGTGKTTLAKKISKPKKSFNGEMTIFLDSHSVHFPDLNKKFILFDFGGQIQFKELIDEQIALLQGAKVIFLCFDLSSYRTFKNLKTWYEKVKELKVPIILLGLKADKQAGVMLDQIVTYQKENNIDAYFPVSSVTGLNILEPFYYAVKNYLKENSDLRISLKALLSST